ncbi:MAG: asparagine--tRNA ligase [Erysipelotrichaceae bacterium]|jgi:asparaginyl-tRNA synthetase|nr:asparagine--tRNA ligase [Erysipelotrichaceae bacterium]
MEIKKINNADLYKAYHDNLLDELVGVDIELDGWVRTNRDNGSIGFLELNDGTFFRNIQLVYLKENEELYLKMKGAKTGAAIKIIGRVILTPENKQPFEIHVKEYELIGDVADDYPLQKKRHSFEFLRENASIRPRANTFLALYRVRSVLAMAIHEFFQKRGFIYVHTPIITTNDAEGAGQVFDVITKGKNPNAFFNHPANLTVSGQLHVEPFALAFKNVYTFGPTFRAENSNTPRHAAEFWMIEPEIAFADLNDDMDLIESCVRYCLEYVLKACPEEMHFFNEMIDKGLLERLNHVLNSKFRRMPYTEAIEILADAVKNGHKFENFNIKWGMDLQSEHERYITEQVIKGPVFLTDYPKEIKAFYMRLNDDGKTVAACDLLVPSVGELVGGSQREERYDLLKAKMDELHISGLDWYLDTRRYGGCKHAGFGIGFDRFLMYITGVSNIRDTEPYPRTAGQIKY